MSARAGVVIIAFLWIVGQVVAGETALDPYPPLDPTHYQHPDPWTGTGDCQTISAITDSCWRP